MGKIITRPAFALLLAAATVWASQAHAQTPTPATPATPAISFEKLEPEVCNDQRDNDGDGKVDCGDLACRAFPACQKERCNDQRDNDADGQIDCADSECAGTPTCSEALNCLNGRDDDGNGKVDCGDSDCAGTSVCIALEAAQAKAAAEEAARKSLPFRRLAAVQALANARKTLAEGLKAKDAKAIGEATIDIETLTLLVKELGAAPRPAQAKKVVPAATPPAAPTPPTEAIPTAQSGFRNGTGR